MNKEKVVGNTNLEGVGVGVGVGVYVVPSLPPSRPSQRNYIRRPNPESLSKAKQSHLELRVM